MSDPRLELLRGTAGALLVVDVQRSFGDPEFLGHLDDAGSAGIAAAVAQVQRAVASARSHDVEVVWLRLRVPPSDPWPASNWFRGLTPADPWPNEWEPCVEGTPGIEFHLVEPAADELVVDKRTYDGFFRTNLAQSLRERGCAWIAVAGLTTDCCILETAGSAFTHGFRVVVLADACAAEDPANHDAALRVLGTHSAVVSDVETLFGQALSAQTTGAAK